MVRSGTMNLQNGTWVNIKKGKIKMENKLKRYVVMSKFNHSDSYMLEKQFVNRSSADKYAELMEEAKEYDNIGYIFGGHLPDIFQNSCLLYTSPSPRD